MKKWLAMWRQLYDDIFKVLNIESLDAAKTVLKSMIVIQIVSMRQNNYIKATLENKVKDAKAKLTRAQNNGREWIEKHDAVR